MMIPVPRIFLVGAILGGVLAVSTSLNGVHGAENDATDAGIREDDMNARRRRLALKNSGLPPSNEDIATLGRLLSRQVFRIEDDGDARNNKSKRTQKPIIDANSNPFSRALQKKNRSTAARSSDSNNSPVDRRRTIGGRNGGGGGFMNGGNGVAAKAFSDIDLPTAGQQEEEHTTIQSKTSSSGAGVDAARGYYYDDHYNDDDGNAGRGSNNNGNGLRNNGRFDDDIYYEPPVPDLVPLKLEAFQDSRNVAPPVLNGPDASELEPGTQYMYSNEPLYPVYLDTPRGDSIRNNGGYVVDDSVAIASVSGKCTRLDSTTGRAYCQYDYHFYDEVGQEEAEITAEGIVQIGEYSTLSITGGSGIFRRTAGSVLLYTGDIGFETNPVFVPNDSIDLPSSYLVEMYIWLDSLALPGEGVY